MQDRLSEVRAAGDGWDAPDRQQPTPTPTAADLADVLERRLPMPAGEVGLPLGPSAGLEIVRGCGFGPPPAMA